MNKNQINFWVDAGLGGLFLAVILSLIANHGHHSGNTVHIWAGLFLLAGVMVHLALHRQWIAAVVRRSNKATHIEWHPHALIFTVYVICGVSGIIQWAAPSIAVNRHTLFEIHAISGIAAIAIQCGHLIHRWKWIKASAQRYLNLRGSTQT